MSFFFARFTQMMKVHRPLIASPHTPIQPHVIHDCMWSVMCITIFISKHKEWLTFEYVYYMKKAYMFCTLTCDLKMFLWPAENYLESSYSYIQIIITSEIETKSLFKSKDFILIKNPLVCINTREKASISCNSMINHVETNATLEHKSSLKSPGYISSNSPKYIVWFKIIHFSLMPKIIRIDPNSKDHVPWRYFENSLL